MPSLATNSDIGRLNIEWVKTYAESEPFKEPEQGALKRSISRGCEKEAGTGGVQVL